MSQDPFRLRTEILHAEDRLGQLKRQLAQVVKGCEHLWNDVAYEPDYQEAYTIPGDPPGTMGVDRQLPCFVPAKTTKRWRRTCKLCGHTETTERTKKVYVSGNTPGCGGEQEVPDFGDR